MDVMSSPQGRLFVGTASCFEMPTSSPLEQLSTRRSNRNRRERRPPTITPKRFNKFFTPRDRFNMLQSKAIRQSGKRLKDITRNAVNHSRAAHNCSPPTGLRGVEDHENMTPRSTKRRRLSAFDDSSPISYSPSKQTTTIYRPIAILEDSDCETVVLDDDVEMPYQRPRQPIRRTGNSGSVSRLLERSFGGVNAIGRGRLKDHCVQDWQCATADFSTVPKDSYSLGTTPLCSAACRTNSLVAVSGESGEVHFMDSLEDDTVDFGKKHISFTPHDNAVMDLCFSSDDLLLASASGDQSARVSDMRTQQTRYLLPGHTSSVKQVRFQPGNDHILATSSRDGSVQIWDLRCRGTIDPLVAIRPGQDTTSRKVYANTCISIRDAHTVGDVGNSNGLLRSSSKALRDSFSRTCDVSITAIEFLPEGREHLLATASSVNSSIKVWDIRAKQYSRRGPATPICMTTEPEAHVKVRPYGLSALALSSDGGRIYSLCRDNSIYAYSTSDLVMGHYTPAYQTAGRKKTATEQAGCRPLYRFKHAQMQVDSFYVKLSIRPARGDKAELLATGSSSSCPVLVPTDELTLSRDVAGMASAETAINHGQRNAALANSLRRQEYEDVPTYQRGTVLIRGHKSEVSALSWTADGDLVTVSDDCRVRCWREGPKARELRIGGEQEGRRWNSGWADVSAEYDEDE